MTDLLPLVPAPKLTQVSVSLRFPESAIEAFRKARPDVELTVDLPVEGKPLAVPRH